MRTREGAFEFKKQKLQRNNICLTFAMRMLLILIRLGIGHGFMRFVVSARGALTQLLDSNTIGRGAWLDLTRAVAAR